MATDDRNQMVFQGQFKYKMTRASCQKRKAKKKGDLWRTAKELTTRSRYTAKE